MAFSLDFAKGAKGGLKLFSYHLISLLSLSIDYSNTNCMLKSKYCGVQLCIDEQGTLFTLTTPLYSNVVANGQCGQRILAVIGRSKVYED